MKTFIIVLIQRYSNHETTVIHGNYSNSHGTHYVNGLVRDGDDQNMVGTFYIDIPKKDTNMVINFTPGKSK